MTAALGRQIRSSSRQGSRINRSRGGRAFIIILAIVVFAVAQEVCFREPVSGLDFLVDEVEVNALEKMQLGFLCGFLLRRERFVLPGLLILTYYFLYFLFDLLFDSLLGA